MTGMDTDRRSEGQILARSDRFLAMHQTAARSPFHFSFSSAFHNDLWQKNNSS